MAAAISNVDSEADNEAGHAPPCFIIVHNIAKRHNVGMLARSASAFGVAKVKHNRLQFTRLRAEVHRLYHANAINSGDTDSSLISNTPLAQMCLVGSRQYNAFGSHGAADHVAFCHFSTLEECCSHLKDQEGESGCTRCVWRDTSMGSNNQLEHIDVGVLSA